MTQFDNKDRILATRKALKETMEQMAELSKAAFDFILAVMDEHPRTSYTYEEIERMTGLNRNRIETFVGRNIKRVCEERKTITKKYVYLDENGKPDMDDIRTRSYQVAAIKKR